MIVGGLKTEELAMWVISTNPFPANEIALLLFQQVPPRRLMHISHSDIIKDGMSDLSCFSG